MGRFPDTPENNARIIRQLRQMYWECNSRNSKQYVKAELSRIAYSERQDFIEARMTAQFILLSATLKVRKPISLFN